MVMAQDRTANDRKVCIGTKEIMREKFHKIKQLDKRISLDLHRCMLAVEHDAVLIVIHIWRILESPRCIVDRDRNDPVVLSCRMVYTACISLIFRTQKAFRITACLGILRCSDRLRILLRFGKVDGNVDISVRTLNFPFLVFLNTIAADIVAVLAQFVEINSRFLRVLLISVPELLLNLCRTRHQTVHKSCIKKITVDNTVLD